MKKLSIPITVFIIIFTILSIGMFPNTANAAKPITNFSIDIWTNKGGQGVGKGGGSYKVGEQIILSVTANLDCQAMVTVTGPGGTSSTQVSVGFNNTKTIPLGTADQSDIGSWQAKAVTLTSFTYSNNNTDIVLFSVTGTVTPTPPSSTIIPATPPPVTQPVTPPPPPVTPAPSSPPATTPPATTTPPVKSGNIPITIDANTSSELMALLALRVSDGKLASDSKLDADKNGKVDMTDARLFLKLAVKKK